MSLAPCPGGRVPVFLTVYEDLVEEGGGVMYTAMPNCCCKWRVSALEEWRKPGESVDDLMAGIWNHAPRAKGEE